MPKENENNEKKVKFRAMRGGTAEERAKRQKQ
jgi:hypothetical protein